MKTTNFFYFFLFIFCLQKEISFSQIDFKNINYDSLMRNYYGIFLIADTKDSILYAYNDSGSYERYSPYSTFKILNSLIGLETGVITDENFGIKWDGKKRWFEVWNLDHNLKSAFANSVVWFYQEVARRIGYKKMKKFIDLVNYGNCDISGGIDNFWLGSSLKISTKEQLKFLIKLINYKLPFKRENVDIVKKIMILKEKDGLILSGKTGSSSLDNKGVTIGWFVGYIQYKSNTYVYVIFLKGKEASGINAKNIIYKIINKSFKINLEE